MTTTDGFVRDPEAIRRAFVIACSRRTLARQHLAAAHDGVMAAESALLKAEEQVLMRERHVDLCDRAIGVLLDEALAHPNVDDMETAGA